MVALAHAGANSLNHGIDSFTSVMIHGKGANGGTSYPDSAIIPNTVTSSTGSQSTDTSQSTLGQGSSIKFIGAGTGGLTWPSSTGCDLVADYTIDFWMRWNSVAGSIVPIAINENTTTSFCGQMMLLQAGNLAFYSSTGSGSWDIANNQNVHNPSTATWYHYAVTRSGNNYKIFVNGALITSFTQAGTPMTTANPDAIGFLPNFSLNVDGWMQEFRISKGIARWTAAFTLPTASYTY